MIREGDRNLDYIWKNSTWGQDLIVVGGKDIIFDSKLYEPRNISNTKEIQLFEVFNSYFYGECTSIILKKPRNAYDELSIGVVFFGTLIPTNPILILHETPGSRFSLVPGDTLSGGSKVVNLEFGKVTMIGIKRSMKKLIAKEDNHEGKCHEYDANDSKEKCYVKDVLAKQLDQMFSSNSSLCYSPQLKNIMPFVGNVTEDLDQCTTFEDYRNVLDLFAPTREKLKCAVPCTEKFLGT